MINLKVKLVGNHWLPCINHSIGDNIFFDEKTERYFNFLDRRAGNSEELNLVFDDADPIWQEINVITFEEQDITRYMTTDDDFTMKFYINGHEFEIHSDLYYLLENYGFNPTMSYQIFL